MTRQRRSNVRQRPNQPPQRRALSNVGGTVHTEGKPESCTLLATVMGDEMDADAARIHVHGFHAYPARMHPILARRCIELMAPSGGTVLDPFCGSGTVLVESRLAGRQSFGVDLNPLAVQLARLKSTLVTKSVLADFVDKAAQVASFADDRRTARRGATRRYPDEDVRLFDPHVLLELDGLRSGLEKLGPGLTRDALWLVFSAILIKVSRQTGDTSDQETKPKRLASGFTISLFERKAQELSRRMEHFRSYVPNPPPEASVIEGDARNLPGVPEASIDLVLSSPPYAGTYDYVDHHRTRLRWLGLEADSMRTEIGARRYFKRLDHAQALNKFSEQMTDVLRAFGRVLKKDGHAVLVIADSVVASDAVWADELIRQCAQHAGLRWVATASQARPHFHGPSRRAFEKRPRQEHTILLAR